MDIRDRYSRNGIRRVCTHEASHILTGLVVGWKLDTIMFHLDDPPYGEHSLAPPHGLTKAKVAIGGLLISVAGAAGEAHAMGGRFSHKLFASDIEDAIRHAKKLGSRDPEKVYREVRPSEQCAQLMSSTRISVPKDVDGLVRRACGAAYSLLELWSGEAARLAQIFEDGFENAQDAASFRIAPASIWNAVRDSIAPEGGHEQGERHA